MNSEELELLISTVNDMKSGKLTKKEKILFVLGIQGGLHADERKVKDLLNDIAEYCLAAEAEYFVDEVKDYDN